MRFKIGLQETSYSINGSSVLHLVATADSAVKSNEQIVLTLRLQSTTNEYHHEWAQVLFPTGATTVTVPYIVPMEWANDAWTVDMNGGHGSLAASMQVDYQITLGTSVYTAHYKGYYAAIPVRVSEDVLPSVGDIEYEAVDDTVPASWGCLVQGVSVVRVRVPNAAGAYGSTILNYYFNGGAAQSQNFVDITLRTAGDVTIPVTVQDTRGRIATKDLYLVVQPYAAPALRTVSSQRSAADGTLEETGTSFLAKTTLKASSVSGHNSTSLCVAWKKVTEQEYCTPVPISVGSALVAANLEGSASYDVKYTLQDAFYCLDTYDYLSSTTYLLHFLKGGSGIAVGKAAEQSSLFDVGLNTTLRRNLQVGGDVNITGELTLGGVAVQAALQSLQTPLVASFSVNTDDFALADVSKNRIVRCGRQIIYCFCGNILAGETPPVMGQTVLIGSIPAGYFDPDYPPTLMAMLNGISPCVVNVSSAGQVSVELSVGYQTSLCVTGFGMDAS